jgi:hypothetical protein
MKQIRTLFMSLSLAAVTSTDAVAQVAVGALTGTVKDTTGAVVAGATVRVVNSATGIGHDASTQSDGLFLIPQVPAGDYRLTVSSAGFKQAVFTNLKVDVGTTLTQDVTLEVGQITESVQVEGQASLVDTTSGAVGTTIQTGYVLEMPLADRNVFRLVNLVPGAFYQGSDISLGGGRTRSAQILIDGVTSSRGGVAAQQIDLTPPVDSMQEFKVEVNAMGAENGRSAAGAVNAVTRSGSNKFTGSFYQFLRNNVFDAAGWNNDAKPPLRRNNFGATIGGPVRRNRTFFFYNYDGLRDRQSSSVTRNVGDPLWRTGNFSTATRDASGRAVAVPIYDPNTGNGDFGNPRNTTPFPNNTIPASRLDPVAVKAAAFLPNPNRPPNNPFNLAGNWQENRADSTTRDYHIGRVDHQISSSTSIFGRYIVTLPERNITAYTMGYGVADPDGLKIDNRRQNIVLNATHLLSPTFIIHATAGFNRVFIFRKAGDCCDTNYGQLLGIPNIPGEVFPRLNFGGGFSPVGPIGASGNANRVAAINNWDNAIRFNRIAGSHSIKFGFQHNRYGGNELSRNQPSGVYAFNGRLTSGFNATGGTIANTGLPFADFLLGRLNSVDASVSPGYGRRIRYYAGYVQDDWRLTPNLTLNLGLRYETETPMFEVAGRMSSFDPYAPSPIAGTGDVPAGALGKTIFPNRNGEGKYLWNQDWNNFAPRFGFAYRIKGSQQSVVRGGFGMFFGNPYDREIVQQLRNGIGNIYRARSPVAYTLRQGPPAEAFADIPESEFTPSFSLRGTKFETSTVQYLDRNRKTPYTLNYNLTIQHQWRGTFFELGFIGNLGRQIIFPNINVNHIRPELLPRTDIPERLRRPITVLGSDQGQVQILAPNWGLSNYHAFTLRTERRFKSGLSWVLAYTWSKWIDNVTFVGGDEATFGDADQIQNIYNLRGERSLSQNHVPHRLVVSPIFELPVGKGKRWLNRGGIANAVLGGWEISTMGTFRSGAPFGLDVLNGPRDVLGDQADGKGLRPDIVGDPNAGVNRGAPANGIRGLAWFNPDAFAVPARFQHGNVARATPGVLGPGYIGFDSMVAKNFRVAERWRAQFRWETFNTFNSPEFNLPNQSLGGGGFGFVTGAGNRRIMQMGLKLYW